MYGGKNQASQAPTAFGSLLQASTYGLTIPVPYGRVQLSLLAIWAQNLREGGSSKKGKSGKKGGTTYCENIDFLIGKAPILSPLQAWNNGTKYALNFETYTTTIAPGDAAAVSIPDGHLYAVIGVTLTQSYSATFDDYGSAGSQSVSGSFEVPLWNESFAGPDPTDSSSPRNWPFCYRWDPSAGATIEIDALPTGSLPGGVLKIYYAQLASSTKYSPPFAKNRLIFENVLGSGDEYDGYESQRIEYPWYSGAGSDSIDLGSAGTIPALKVEAQTKWGLYPTGDCDFVDIIEDIVKSGITQLAIGAGGNFGATEHGLGQYGYPGAIQKKFGRTSSGAHPSLAFNMPNTAGSILVCVATGNAALSIASSAGETWTPVIGGTPAYQAWYATAEGGTNTVTVSGSTGGGEVQILEIGGVGTVDTIGAGVYGKAVNAYGAIALGSRGFGGCGACALWTEFAMDGSLPEDAVITGIYQVIIWSTANGSAGVAAGLSLGISAGGLWPSLVGGGVTWTHNAGGYSYRPLGSLDLADAKTSGIGVEIASSGAAGEINPPATITAAAIGCAIYYESAVAPIGAPPIDAPFTPSVGQYVAWMLPAVSHESNIVNGGGFITAHGAWVEPSTDSGSKPYFVSSGGLFATGSSASLGKGTAQSTVQSGFNGYQLAIPFYSGSDAPADIDAAKWDLLTRQNLHGEMPVSFQTYGRIARSPGDTPFAAPGASPTALAMIAVKDVNPPTNARAAGSFIDPGSLELTRAQCRANGLWGSLAMTSQRAASDWINELLEAANAVAFMSGHHMKIMPRSEVSAAGNGAIYIAPTAGGPVADLDVDNGDFVSVPQLVRKARTDTDSVLQMQHLNRSSDYQQVTTAQPDSAAIALYGVRKKDPSTNNAVQDVAIARSILAVQVRRRNYVDNVLWKFSLNTRWQSLDNWDLITITDRLQGIVKVPVRLTSIEEDDKYELKCEAEPYIYGIHALQPITATGTDPYNPGGTTSTSAGDVNAPLIFEPVPRLYGSTNQAQLWLVISSNAANYGGAQVYISTDSGASYNAIGDPVKGSAITGTLEAEWPAAADPDTTNNLEVDLAESAGVLDSYAVTDEDNFLYPCIVAGGGASAIPYELMTYAVATMTAAHKYTLQATGGNKLRRAVFNAPAISGAGCEHPSGSRWAFLSPAGTGILKLPMDAAWIGKILHFKICSFNSFGAGAQALTEATDYTFTPTGGSGSVNPYGLPAQSFQVNGA